MLQDPRLWVLNGSNWIIWKLGIDSRLGLAFGFPVALVLVMGMLSIQNIRDISDTTEMLYRHPFAVSRAMLRIDANIVRMHRSMKDAVLAEDAAALNESARLVRQLESEVLQDLELVKERFLGDQNDIIGLAERVAMQMTGHKTSAGCAFSMGLRCPTTIRSSIN